MWTLLRRLVLAWLGMWGSLFGAGWVADTVFGGGRTFAIVPLTVLFLFLFALVIRARFRWRIRDFAAAYVLSLATSVLVISFMSGYGVTRLVEGFDASWFMLCAGGIGIGWWTGCALGTLFRSPKS